MTSQDVSDRRNLDGTVSVKRRPSFRLLARASHTPNRKLRDIAEELTRLAPCRSNRVTAGWASPFVFLINRICRLIVKRKGMEMSVSTRHQPAPVLSMSF